MKNQYVGDINDYRKYGLLRILARRLTIGVCWMLTKDDGRPDGLKIKYLDAKERWRSHDSDLFEVLYKIVKKENCRHICEVENRGVIPSGLFYSELLVSEKEARCAYFSSAFERLRSSDIIFFDPDNGVRYRLGWSRRYLYGDELARAFRRGHSVLATNTFHMNCDRRSLRALRNAFGMQRRHNGLCSLGHLTSSFFLLPRRGTVSRSTPR
ncbi:MAG TPA: hypothetical protein VI455_02735 [Terriglobia bacterium]